MEQYLDTALAFAERITAQEMALTAAILFGTVICMRALRLLRPQAQRKNGFDRKTVTPATVVDDDSSYLPPKSVAPLQPNKPAKADQNRAAVRPVTDIARPKTARPRIVDVTQKPEGAAPSNVAQALSKISFAPKPMMPWEHYCLLRDIEAFLADHGAGHRLFSKVQLSDAFGIHTTQMSDELGHAVGRALAPFKVDFLILDRHGMPSLALHMTPANPVLETVFDKAEVPLLVLPSDYSWTSVEAQLSSYLGAPLQPLRRAG